MRAGQCPPAYLGVAREAAQGHGVEVHRALHVPELPHVIVMAAIAGPAEEHVAGGLHQPLADHDALPLVLELGTAGVRREHRVDGLLELEEEWRAPVGIGESRLR